MIECKCERCGLLCKKTERLFMSERVHLCSQCKRKETNMKKYGYENPWKSKEIQKENRDKFKLKYNVDNPWNLKEIQDKCKETQIQKFGSLAFNTDKSKLTKINRYKDENYNNRNKAKKTCLEKYNVDNIWKSKETKEKIKITLLKKYGIDSVLKLTINQEKSKEKKRINNYKRIISSERLKNFVTPLFDESDYNNTLQYLKWKCNKCGNIFNSTLERGKIPRCLSCFPYITGTSNYEVEIIDFIKSLNVLVETKNRTIIDPLELDIYIPSHNLAIEFDGLYWHSELQGKDSKYHLNKTNMCEKNGIQLLHIWENEWCEKQDIVKSIIKSKLGIYSTKIHGRKCIIKEISNQESLSFYFENHLQNSINSKINLGLYYEDELVSCISFSKPRYNKKYDFEIIRFANKLNYRVYGSFSKMWKYFLNNYNPNSIITYSDKRYFNGSIYKKYLKEMQDSKPSYYYFKYKEFFSRLEFQKHKLSKKLKIFDDTLTEWENMQLNNYDRIWDCGNKVFEWKKSI